MKKLILIVITIFMFLFKNSATANYEKIFYDFNIESIDGVPINDLENLIYSLPESSRNKVSIVSVS